MRWRVGQNEGCRLALADDEITLDFLVAGMQRDGCPQHDLVRPGDRAHRAVILTLDPRNPGAITEADRELHPHDDAPAPSDHEADEVGSLGTRWHELHELDGAVPGLDLALQDQRVASIAPPGDAGLGIDGRQKPSTVALVAEQRREARIGIESRPAKPVDRPVAADQGGRFAIAHECIVFDPQRHDAALNARAAKMLRRQAVKMVAGLSDPDRTAAPRDCRPSPRPVRRR